MLFGASYGWVGPVLYVPGCVGPIVQEWVDLLRGRVAAGEGRHRFPECASVVGYAVRLAGSVCHGVCVLSSSPTCAGCPPGSPCV